MVGIVDDRFGRFVDAWSNLYNTVVSVNGIKDQAKKSDLDSKLTIMNLQCRRIAELLVRDFSKHQWDGVIVKFFIDNDIASTLLQTFKSTSCIEATAILVEMWNSILVHGCDTFLNHLDVIVFLVGLIDHCKEQRGEFGRIREVLCDFMWNLFNLMQRSNLILNNFRKSSSNFDSISCQCLANLLDVDMELPSGNQTTVKVRKLVQLATTLGLINSILIDSIVLHLTTVFSSGTVKDFISAYEFLDNCIEACQTKAGVLESMIERYRHNFVDRIWASALRGSDEFDGSLGVLMKVQISVTSSSFKSKDLMIPMIAETIKTLDDCSEISEELAIELADFLSNCLHDPKLLFACSLQNDSSWVEIASLHRQRCQSLFHLVVENFHLPGICNEQDISSLYRIHLMSVDRLILDPEAAPTSNSTELSELVPKVVSNQAFHRVLSIYLKKLQADFWIFPEQDLLSIVEFLLAMLCRMDVVIFYSHLDRNCEASLLSVLLKILAHNPCSNAENSSLPKIDLQPYVLEHQTADPFHSPSSRGLWLAFLENEPQMARLYLLAHVFLRLSSIIQVRASRKSVRIIFE